MAEHTFRDYYGYDSHAVRLFIINNPHARKISEIADECACSPKSVIKEMKALNIQLSTKPGDCHG